MSQGSMLEVDGMTAGAREALNKTLEQMARSKERQMAHTAEIKALNKTLKQMARSGPGETREVKVYDKPKPVRRGTIKAGPKQGRNDPCACGSGKKHKGCCAVKMRRIDQACRIDFRRAKAAFNAMDKNEISLEQFEQVITDIIAGRPEPLPPSFELVTPKDIRDAVNHEELVGV